MRSKGLVRESYAIDARIEMSIRGCCLRGAWQLCPGLWRYSHVRACWGCNHLIKSPGNLPAQEKQFAPLAWLLAVKGQAPPASGDWPYNESRPVVSNDKVAFHHPTPLNTVHVNYPLWRSRRVAPSPICQFP